MPIENENDDGILTTSELSQILHLNENALIRLAEEGILPASRIANEFKFSQEAICEWLDVQVNQNKYSEALLQDLEKGTSNKAFPISKILRTQNIYMNMKAESKEQALIELVEYANQTGLVKNSQELLTSLQNREILASTAIDHGIAFPHPRKATFSMVKNVLILMAVSSKGIEFGAMDKQPVRLFVLLVSPILPLHLQILSRFAIIFRDAQVKEKVLASQTPEKILEIIQVRENFLDLPKVG